MEKDKFARKIEAYALKNAIEHKGKARVESVLNALFHEGLKKEQVKDVIEEIRKQVEKINSLSLEEQKQKFSSLQQEISHRVEREGLPELPNADKGVVTRFAPSPSGPLHIGHVATAMPSSLYAKKYGGKFYIRIEDTNPKNIDPKAYEMIPEEANWLFGNVSEVIIQSDRMEVYYKYAEELIKKNKAYVCICDPKKFRELKKAKKECPCRNLSVEENLKRWKKMLNKNGYREGEAVLRFKSDLQLKNPAFRDFPLARIIEAKHPRQGKKYRVWPLMALGVAVDDMEYGMTHVIRAKEHRDSAIRQEMIFEAFGKKPPYTFFLGRYKFKDFEISCSKTRKLIEEKKFSGWDDIRLPFIAALRKRGYQPEAFAKMAEARGLSEVDKVISKEDYFEILDNFNREIIKDKAKKIEFSEQKQSGFKEITILMPDATKKKAFAKIKDIKDGEIVYFQNFGYARLNGNEFWFCHK
ncbi:MAG: glutamate--tRNA ligase family protein [Candidatus Pacearchaeota archaeon]